MTKPAGDNGKLTSFNERLLKLHEEKDQLVEMIGEVYAEAKSQGHNTKALRRAIAIQRKDQDKWRQEEADLELVLHSLGLL